MTVGQFETLFPHEDACKAYLTANRWPDGIVRCPRCGFEAKPHSMPYHWNCYKCSPDAVGYRFSVLVGTIFENTNKPLREWFRVIHLIVTSKKGISALQVKRYMGFGSYETALNMCNKIRTALGNIEFKQLMGVVEVDETYVGGKWKNKHGGKGPGGHSGHGGTRGRGPRGKMAVVGAVRRKGNVIARVVDKVNSETLDAFVREAVSHSVSLLCTDENPGYKRVGKDYPHEFVAHTRGQYVHGNVHTQTIEGFWSLVKRGIVGTFHKVSRKYLPLYVNEFEFRYNNRDNPDIFGAVIRAC
jgi:transposase-like protein